MAAMVMILGVLVSVVLLAQDTKRRKGQIAYLRVFLAVGITFFGAASGYYNLDTIDFLARYAGMLTFLWFAILRPKTKAEEFFKKGVSLLKAGEIEPALSAFSEGLTTTNKNKEKGYLLYNSAICNMRLQQHDIAMATLHQALDIFPPLKSKARKDNDFSALHNNKQFKLLFNKKKVEYECDKCGTTVTAKDKICPKCLEPFEDEAQRIAHCENCGTDSPAGISVCPKCGRELIVPLTRVFSLFL